MDHTVHGILQARILVGVAIPFSRGSSQPRDRTFVSCIEADSLPAEPPGKPKNTGVGSLSLLQQIFLSQESNRGLLHCRRILYQLSYQHLWKMTFEQHWDKGIVGHRKEKMCFIYQLLIVSVMQDIQQFIAPPVPYAAVLRDRITASKTPIEQFSF